MAVETGRPVNLTAPPRTMEPEYIGMEWPPFYWNFCTNYEMTQDEVIAAGG